MPYDFDTPVSRRGSGSIKWDVGENELPMWVADMDFAAAPAIRAALERRAAHGVFGYTDTDEGWRAAYRGWWRRRHGLEIESEALVFCTGVVPAISSAVRKLTTPAEKVVLLTPVYNIFFNSILNNGRVPGEVPLLYENNAYSIDWAALEAALADPQARLLLLCNPHNPVGRIWTKEELARIGALCERYGVTVFSDEIHCDITVPGKRYTPFAAASEVCRRISVTAVAPTKAFNLAGIQTAAVFAHDPVLRHKMWRGINTDEVGEPNVFAVPAAVAAFNESEAWLDEMNAYVAENRRFAQRFIAARCPGLVPVPGEATYLLWIHCGALGTGDAVQAGLREKTGLYLSAGTQYGRGGEAFLRMNLACPRSTVEDGVERLRRFTLEG